VEASAGGAPARVSVFAGRLADAGVDYRSIMREAIKRARETSNVEIIWASTCEVFNVIEAHEIACHIITAPAAVLTALGTKSAAELSLDAVKAFRGDAIATGLTLTLVDSQRAAEELAPIAHGEISCVPMQKRESTLVCRYRVCGAVSDDRRQ
jgi:transaldolase